MEREFGYKPSVFRNTELIYFDKLSDVLLNFPHIKTILIEGADKILMGDSLFIPDFHTIMLTFCYLNITNSLMILPFALVIGVGLNIP